MKAAKSILLVFSLILCTTSLVWTQEFNADQPFLITAAGQSGDVTMVKILAQKAKLKFKFDKLAKPELLKNFSTLVFVTGGSTKGLGAAKIDKNQELDRVRDLIKSAKKNQIKIVTMHVGGKSRRGKLSDEFNTLTAKNSDCLIVVKGGDEDQLFSNIAEENKIPFFTIEKILNAGKVMEDIFSK